MFNPIIELYRLALSHELSYEIIEEIAKCDLEIDNNNKKRAFIRKMITKYLLLQISTENNNIDVLFNDGECTNIQLIKDIRNYFLKFGPQKSTPEEIIFNLQIREKCLDFANKMASFIQNKKYLIYSYDISVKNNNDTITFDIVIADKLNMIDINNCIGVSEKIREIFNMKPLDYSKNIMAIFNGEYIINIPLNLYEKVVKRAIKNKTNGQNLDMIIYCLLLRYQSLNINGCGLSIPDEIAYKMKEKMSIDTEAFSSIINCNLDNYYSLFYDIEKIFGSNGSFFNSVLMKGNYEINPPFDEEIIKMTVEKIIDSIKNSHSELLFFLIIPQWDNVDEYGIFDALDILYEYNEIYKCITYSTVILSKDHKYIDCTKNNKKNATNTQIFIIQNDISKLKFSKNYIENAADYIINLWKNIL